jgi:hypothetical protein
VGFLLHREARILEELEIFDFARVFEVDEDTNALAGSRLEGLFQEAA